MSNLKRQYCRANAHTMTNKQLAKKLNVTPRQAGRWVIQELQKVRRENLHKEFLKQRLEQ